MQELYEESGLRAVMMVVGDEPDMGRFALALTGSALPVQPATVFAVEVPSPESRRGTLRGVYDPDVMASIGRGLVVNRQRSRGG